MASFQILASFAVYIKKKFSKYISTKLIAVIQERNVEKA